MKRLKSNLYWCLTSAKRKTKAEQSKRYCINKAKSYVKGATQIHNDSELLFSKRIHTV